jgi:outer membrane protein assembly factor BamB
VRRADTTISCRAFALTALLIAVCAARAAAGDRPPLPGLPLARWWSVELDGAVSAGPVSDGSRVFIALASAQLTARDAADGHEIWRQKRSVTAPMAAAGDRLFVAGGDAIEALDGATGKTMWTLPRVTPVAPLMVANDWLIATTDTELIAIRAATGEVIWRQPGGGVTLAPALDGDRLYTGAADGRVLALDLKDGAVAWQKFFSGGITAIAAHRGRVYAGTGDKILYCLDGTRKGEEKWPFRLGGVAAGNIAVDDQHVYVAAVDNVVRALDRQSGNQRWKQGLPYRPSLGVYVATHVVFAPVVATELPMLYDHDGRISGYLHLPGEAPPKLTPSIRETKDGTIVFAVTGGLTNEWSLAKFAPAGEAGLIPVAKLEEMPGVPYLTDPTLVPIGKLLGLLILGDPRLLPLSEVDWPIVLRDPPLVPLTTLPGVQLRPLSPKLPVRPGGSGPGG